ncbi:alpha/beta fold hydrolase [Pseudomonas sp. GM60]|uniref:alpha/beta fold hydrolase n=1 Tax=Pseudomonas sp. GM60 TaxID=1144334 RepID=UPI0002709E6D|nr:alpha/beta hydrolase [Pseudomonas sp. GM60]EJM79184.1 putative hydrolase or acyltransferase of alpha/beta superfamily [Pseudomonas sp. GM60]
MNLFQRLALGASFFAIAVSGALAAPAATHNSAPNQFVEADGVRYAYRQFGAQTGVPVILLQHFRGNLDYWDPAVTDGLAKQRPVYLFDNAGVGLSSGETPDSFEGMADHVAAFARTRGLKQVDVLGFSIGGMVAQEVALRHPQLVRRLILAGTSPRGGIAGNDPRVPEIALRESIATLEETAYLFFDPAPSSQLAAREFWERRHQRTEGLDKLNSMKVIAAQGAALGKWNAPGDGTFAQLSKITQPTLVVNGSKDIMVPTQNSFTLQQHIPNAKLLIYPNSGHGALFQYADDFVQQANAFLN